MNNEYEELNELNGERGIPSVNEQSSKQKVFFIFILLLVVVAVIGVGYWKYSSNQIKQAPKEKDLVKSAVPTRTFLPLPEEPKPELPKKIAPPPVITPPIQKPIVHKASIEKKNESPVLDKSGSSLMVTKARKNNKSASNTSNSSRKHSGNGGMAKMLTATNTDRASAGWLGNQNYILAKGSFIDCGLRTRLDSTVPGMTSCRVTRNIYSDNGKVLLIERGSVMDGEYKNNLKQGQNRIFVLWSRIKMPSGVIVHLDSPGTDPLGGSGLPGYVDTHFWQRFGGALMLSLVDDFARVISTETSNSDSQINFNSTSSAATDMSTEALKNSINIPPTLYKNQGEQIGIYVARDLDFSEVYNVTAE